MRRRPASESAAGRVRCAIYTRKSTEENLDSEFNSLDAQRESAEAYIASQRHEGWVALPAHYDDGGFSGGKLYQLPMDWDEQRRMLTREGVTELRWLLAPSGALRSPPAPAGTS
jgi:hypothetical protein